VVARDPHGDRNIINGKNMPEITKVDILLAHLENLLRDLPIDSWPPEKAVQTTRGIARYLYRKRSRHGIDLLARVTIATKSVEFVLYKGESQTTSDTISIYAESIEDPEFGNRLVEHIKSVT
jgi:hypothetical protein